jgi:hypothetical protein
LNTVHHRAPDPARATAAASRIHLLGPHFRKEAHIQLDAPRTPAFSLDLISNLNARKQPPTSIAGTVARCRTHQHHYAGALLKKLGDERYHHSHIQSAW